MQPILVMVVFSCEPYIFYNVGFFVYLWGIDYNFMIDKCSLKPDATPKPSGFFILIWIL